MSAAKAKTRGNKAPSSEPSPFARVWSFAVRIPKGRVATYGLLSELIDGRLTPVGVGWAVRAAGEGTIPWHRIVNAQGGISTDKEHPGLQRALLEAEGVVFDTEGRIDLARYGWRPRRAAPSTARGGRSKAGRRSRPTR